MEFFETVTEALNGLREKGYVLDFNIAFDKLMCNENNVCLNPDEFEIVEVYRFEGDSNPSDEDVVYAIASKDGNSKGVVTSAFGMYADNACAEMIKKLSIKKS